MDSNPQSIQKDMSLKTKKPTNKLVSLLFSLLSDKNYQP